MTTLLQPAETIAVGRVRLSPLTDAAVGDMPWLEAALSPEWGLEDFEAAREESCGLLVSDEDGTAMGLALVRFDAPSAGNAVISFLAMQPERRYRGLGGEAGLAVERLLRERLGARCVYVGVPEGRGLAVYFWLRLGFRPLSIAQAPKASLGLTVHSMPGIWMVRDRA
jgi:GNAT superfamily N-acetyltransferase